MDTARNSEVAATKNPTTLERKSDRELVITRTINGPARLVYQAFAKADLFKQWWVPKSFGINLLSCESDVRTGGHYRLVFKHGDGEMAFFGKYIEVIPGSRIVWTNDESGDAGSVSTATFEEKGGKTLIVLHELYPNKEACDAALASGEKDGMNESFDQLEQLIASPHAA